MAFQFDRVKSYQEQLRSFRRQFTKAGVNVLEGTGNPELDERIQDHWNVFGQDEFKTVFNGQPTPDKYTELYRSLDETGTLRTVITAVVANGKADDGSESYANCTDSWGKPCVNKLRADGMEGMVVRTDLAVSGGIVVKAGTRMLDLPPKTQARVVWKLWQDLPSRSTGKYEKCFAILRGQSVDATSKTVKVAATAVSSMSATELAALEALIAAAKAKSA